MPSTVMFSRPWEHYCMNSQELETFDLSDEDKTEHPPQTPPQKQAMS